MVCYEVVWLVAGEATMLSCVLSVHCNSVMFRASRLMLEIKEFRCYEAKIEESEKRPVATGSQTQDTSDLSRQCSATELRQPDNHQPLHIMFKQSVTLSLQSHPLCRTRFSQYQALCLLALSLCIHMCTHVTQQNGFSVRFYLKSRVRHLHKWEAGI